MKTEKVKRKKISFKKIFILLLFLYVISCFIYYLIKLPIKNIYISGTSYLSDVEIIEAVNLKNYPSILKTNPSSVEKKLKKLALIKDVKVKRNIFGKLSIDIVENKILYLNRSTDKIILENKLEIENINKYYGLPILINYVPDTIENDLITGLSKIDYSVLELISEIEYSENKNGDIIIDDTRFLLRMNDGNQVYMNTVNIRKLNKYPEISIAFETQGILYLDSSNEENSHFIPYSNLPKEEATND